MRVVRKALTFDDVLLVPAHSLVVPRDVSLVTRLTRSITLNTPLLSAAMDTVTDSRLAIGIAQEGGLGIVHKNMPPARQAAEVAKVKRFESGVVKDPITIPPSMSVREVLALTQQHRISGLPVVDGKRVVGIVTNRDLRFETNLDQPVSRIMTRMRCSTPDCSGGSGRAPLSTTAAESSTPATLNNQMWSRAGFRWARRALTISGPARPNRICRLSSTCA